MPIWAWRSDPSRSPSGGVGDPVASAVPAPHARAAGVRRRGAWLGGTRTVRGGRQRASPLTTGSPAVSATRLPAGQIQLADVRPARRSLASLAGRGGFWAVLANITMRFASVAVTAILARLLSKEDFGVFAVALAVYLIVASLAELGMGSAVARSPIEPADIAPTVATISILVSRGLRVAMAAFAPQLASAARAARRGRTHPDPLDLPGADRRLRGPRRAAGPRVPAGPDLPGHRRRVPGREPAPDRPRAQRWRRHGLRVVTGRRSAGHRPGVRASARRGGTDRAGDGALSVPCCASASRCRSPTWSTGRCSTPTI